MSLGRLLAAGKSLIGLRGGEGRYRENKRARLPKFGSPKNPFAPMSEPDPSAANNAGANQAVVQNQEPTVPKVAPAPARPARAAHLTGWLAEWSARFNPLARSRRPPGPVRSLLPQQGELSLDRVQVVRNDLRDADLEVTRPTVAKPVSPVVARTAEKLEPVGAAWNRLATRFLGEDQT